MPIASSGAADKLSLPRATVTITMQALENLFQVRLLNLTTRSVNLTRDGAAYSERCARILSDASPISPLDAVAKKSTGKAARLFP